MDYRRKRTTTLLRMLVRRIQGNLEAEGHDDLSEGVELLHRLAQEQPARLTALRPEILRTLEGDEWLEGAARYIEDVSTAQDERDSYKERGGKPH